MRTLNSIVLVHLNGWESENRDYPDVWFRFNTSSFGHPTSWCAFFLAWLGYPIVHVSCELCLQLTQRWTINTGCWVDERHSNHPPHSSLRELHPLSQCFFLVTIHFKSQSADLPQSPTHSNKMQFTLLTSIIMAFSTSVLFVVDIQLKNQWLSCSRCSGVCIPCASSSRSPRSSSTREYIVINSMASLLTFFPAHRSYCCCSWSRTRGKPWAHLRAI